LVGDMVGAISGFSGFFFWVYGVVCWDTDRAYRMPRLDVLYIDIMLRPVLLQDSGDRGRDSMSSPGLIPHLIA